MEFSDKELTELNKISELSSRNAASALSLMIGKKVSVKFPNITVEPINEIKKLKGEMIISMCELEGDMQGNIILVFSKEEGMMLLDVLMMQELGTLNEMTKESEGAFNELNNIVGGAYISALANYLSVQILPKPPKFMVDFKKIENELLGQIETNILLIDAVLSIGSSEMEGMIFMLLNDESLTKLIEQIKSR